MGPGADDPDDGPDHPRGKGHAGQDPGDVRQGDAPEPGDPTSRPSPRCASTPRSSPRRRTRSRARRSRSRASRRLPSGQTFRDIKLARTRRRGGRQQGRHGHRRGRVPAGDFLTVFEEIVEVKDATGEAHLKVILETGELETRTTFAARACRDGRGGRFHQDVHRQGHAAATLPVTLVMLEAIRDFERSTGRQVGMKPPGGIRTAKEAIRYLVVLYETLGPRWMSPDWFRFGRLPPQRRPDAVRVPAHRPLPGPRPLHARLSRGARRPSAEIRAPYDWDHERRRRRLGNRPSGADRPVGRPREGHLRRSARLDPPAGRHRGRDRRPRGAPRDDPAALVPGVPRDLRRRGRLPGVGRSSPRTRARIHPAPPACATRPRSTGSATATA